LCVNGDGTSRKDFIPELLETKARREYFEALNLADVSWLQGQLDVSAMETLIDRLFIEQLQSA
jgi:hypothetical protein